MTRSRIDKAAAVIRKAMIESGLTHTPDREFTEWKDLPEDRRHPWRVIAAVWAAMYER